MGVVSDAALFGELAEIGSRGEGMHDGGGCGEGGGRSRINRCIGLYGLSSNVFLWLVKMFKVANQREEIRVQGL